MFELENFKAEFTQLPIAEQKLILDQLTQIVADQNATISLAVEAEYIQVCEQRASNLDSQKSSLITFDKAFDCLLGDQ